MQQPMQPILQHLFQASSLDDISRQRLESFVQEYPSFGIGHYLLSRKLKAEGSDEFAAETQKTSLYFTNPFWLQWQLDHVAMAGGHVERAAAPAFAPETAFAPEPEAAPVSEPVFEPEATSTPVFQPESPQAGEPVAEIPAVHGDGPVIAEEPGAAAETMGVGEPAAEPVVASAPEEPVYTGAVGVAGESYNLPSGDDLAEALTSAQPEEASAADQLLRSIEEARAVRDSLQKINTDFDVEIAVAGETLPTEPAAVIEPAAVESVAAVEPIVPGEEPILDEEAPFVLDEAAKPAPESEPIVDEEPPFVLDEPEAVVIAPETAASPAIPTLPGQTVDAGLVFEPYHTVDYFASQGIKLSLDDPKDKLGKQLKSFTEWLKGMRRLPQKDREVIPDRVAEEAVQNIAAHSIEGKEVMTETMADVLAMQGMRERARAVYEKLSLLNPEKRAYFAAKIEQLNIP